MIQDIFRMLRQNHISAAEKNKYDEKQTAELFGTYNTGGLYSECGANWKHNE